MELGKEAAKLAENPVVKHFAVPAGASTVAGIATYQVNAHLAKKTGVAAPPISATTGGMPNGGENLAHTASTKYSKRHKGGK